MIYKSQKKISRRIAIVGTNTNELFTTIRSGMIARLDKEDNLSYTFGVANGANDEAGMKDVVREVIFARHYDLLLSIGKSSTRIAHQLTRTYRAPIPIFFTSVLEPVQSGFIKSTENSGNNLTGFEAFERNYTDQMETLLHIIEKPLKKVLVLYAQFTYSIHAQEIIALLDWLKEHNIPTVSIGLENGTNAGQEIMSILPSIDMVILPRDSTLVSFIEDIICACNLYRKPIYASDLTSVELGASMGFGSDEFLVGFMTAEKALPILLYNEKPINIPTTLTPWEPKLLINRNGLIQQGLKINFQKLEELVTVRTLIKG